ncbi:mitogen-activated protein kinase kinase kinase 20-like [Rutidosis leptorrhynchoides]|uniref:mitogen-activated protein kinase kinase kinase 20-like n=1 Tax=Rutidosis leptorrhynchoides TaxID=125765 RepID=UPI003A98DED2
MEWVRGETIGHGTFAEVSLAKPINQINSCFPELVAVKSCDVAQSDSLVKECKILKELKDCPEIINCYGDSITVENGEKLYNVVLEYASGGCLSDKVKSSENLKLSEHDVRRYSCSILKAIKFIHQKGFVHCDIKLDNILVFNNDDVKIADFGLARKTAEDSKLRYDIRGTPFYMAPETVNGGQQKPASDVWAFGCLVLEMLTGQPVWGCIDDVCVLFMKIGVGAEIPEIPREISEAGKDFLGKCFVKDSSKRWTAEMLLEHPFIINGIDQTTCSSDCSPRNPFDFHEWELDEPVSPVWPVESESESESEFEGWNGDEICVLSRSRLRELANNVRLDWSDRSSWINVR